MGNLIKKALFLMLVSLLLMPVACQKKITPIIPGILYPLTPDKFAEKENNQEKRILSEVYSKEMFYKEKYFEVGYYKPIGIYKNVFEYYYWGSLYRLNLQNYTEEKQEGVLKDFWYEKYDLSNILSDDTAYYYIDLIEDGPQNEAVYHIVLICKDRNNFAILWKRELYKGEFFSYINRLFENTDSIFVSISQTYQLFCIDKKDGCIKWVFEPAKTDKKVVFRDGSDCMADIGNKSISCEFVCDDGVIVHLSSVDQKGSANIYNQYYLVSFNGKLLNTFNEEPMAYFEDTYFYQEKRYFGYKKMHNNQIVWKKLHPPNEESRFFQIKDYVVRTNEKPAGLTVTVISSRNGSIVWRKIIPSTKRYMIEELDGNYYILFQDLKDESRYRIVVWNAQTKGEKWIEITNQIEKKHTPHDEWTLMPSFDEYFVNDISMISCSGNVFMLTRLGFFSLHDDQAIYYPYKTDAITYNFSLFENQTTFVLSYTAGGQGIIPGGKLLVLKDTPEEKSIEQKDINQPANKKKDEEETKETIPEWKKNNSKQDDPDFMVCSRNSDT